MRGKYAARAATKRTEAETENLIAAYKKQIADLKKHAAKVESDAKRAAKAQHDELTRLHSELHEAVSPELKAAKRQLLEARDRLGSVRIAAAERIKRGQIAANIMFNALRVDGNYPVRILDEIEGAVGGRERFVEIFGWKLAVRKELAGTRHQNVDKFKGESLADIMRNLG